MNYHNTNCLFHKRSRESERAKVGKSGQINNNEMYKYFNDGLNTGQAANITENDLKWMTDRLKH